MKKWPLIALIVIGAAAIAFATWQEFKGALPAVLPPSGDISDDIKTGSTPLTLPDGFNIEIFAENLPGVRVLVGPDQMGNYWLSQMSEGTVSTLEIGDDGKVERVYPVFQNLKNPHGLALDDEDGIILYIAEEDKISRARLYSDAPLEKIADLPSGGRHTSRTIKIGPDEHLYISIGSSCDACEENVDERAVIWRMSKDGSQKEVFARGIRNAVFFDWDPVDGRMWATEMGRDFLGDNLPPDEVNIIEEGSYYGWPWYYGKNVRDSTYMPNSQVALAFPLKESHIDLQAHSAPLGLSFIPEEGWPEDMALDLLVAYHGSWNRSQPTGYKIVRFDLDQETRQSKGVADFITGWLRENNDVLGRPVGLLVLPGATLFITDDKAGVIYRLTRNTLD